MVQVYAKKCMICAKIFVGDRCPTCLKKFNYSRSNTSALEEKKVKGEL